MEGKNSSSPRFPASSDETLGRKEPNPMSASPGYFSTVIPPASHVIAKNLSHSDLCWTLNKQRNDGRIASAQTASTDCKSQGSSTKVKPGYANEHVESPYFGSSINYGARDFYTSSSSPRTSKTPEKYRMDEGDDLSNIHLADRGEWWQGSLYY
ncbi:uncharacterized protein LOC141824976 isoform X1 [Curcuma longa]|uniref:uncharacterized protein LOC141824976 isoform X1 n=1 Tax=Curcuma longa TaxID=136217 RepID=UPI003D9F8118